MSDTSSGYDGFDRMPIAGEWIAGSSGSLLRDTNPYDDDLLVEMPRANVADVDTAYRGAKLAQPTWAETHPSDGRPCSCGPPTSSTDGPRRSSAG